MVKYIKSNYLNQFPELEHGYCTKIGGVSKGIYSSLNLGLNSYDNKQDILKNFQILANDLAISKNNIIILNQYHSNQALNFTKKDNYTKLYYKADAIITNLRNIAISVFTADCVPLLIYAKDVSYIAAIHAGWHGAFTGIIENSIKKLAALGANIAELHIAVMPSITEDSYEVDLIFYENFIGKNQSYISYFKKNSREKFQFNLRAFVIDICKNFYIKNIDNLEIDTYKNEDICYSHRKATHASLIDTGRNLSFIMLK
jgi:YfiH family protein